MKKFLMFALAASVISSNTCIAASYIAQDGDTLQGVAYKFGVSYNELMKANPGIDSEHIKYGFRIEIPERKVVQNRSVIHIVNTVPQPKPYKPVVMQHTTPTGTTITIVNPVPKHQPQPQPYVQHTTPTGPTITIVEEDAVY